VGGQQSGLSDRTLHSVRWDMISVEIGQGKTGHHQVTVNSVLLDARRCVGCSKRSSRAAVSD
jgi:hypothetical protein